MSSKQRYLIYGLQNNKIINIENVESGLACNCQCPSCGEKLVAKKGKKVIAVPRLAKYGEHVDDHQLQLLHQFDDLQLICACYDVEQLGECYKNLQNMHFRPYVSNTSVVIASIDEYLQSLE